MPSALLPIAALIRRELVSSLRQWRFYALMAVLVLLAVTALLLVYPDHPRTPMAAFSASRSIFVFIAYLLAIGSLVVVPATSGSSIASEREEETLDLLAMTSAKPWHVLASKLVNSIGHYFLILVALMPVIASSYFLVGLDTDLFWRVLYIITATTLACSAAGVMCSCLFKRPAVAVGSSYLCMLSILGLPVLLALVVLSLFDVIRFQDSMSSIGIYVTPYLAFLLNITSPTRRAMGSPFLSAVACGTLWTVATIVIVAVSHRLVARRWGKSESPRKLSLARKASGKAARKSRGHSFARRINPMYLKEIWFEMSLCRGTGLFVVLIPFGLALAATTLIVLCRYLNPDESSFAQAFMGWELLQALLLPALLIAATGNLFTKEDERSTIDALRVSLLSPTAILTGKLCASLRAALVIILSALAGSAPLLLVPQISRLAIVLGFIMLASCMVMAWAISSLASATHRKMVWAFVTAYVATAMAIIGNLVLLEVVLVAIAGGYSSDALSSLSACLSPLVAFLTHVKVGYLGIYVNYHQDKMTGLWSLAYSALVVLGAIGLCYLGFMGRYLGWRRKLSPPTIRPLASRRRREAL